MYLTQRATAGFLDGITPDSTNGLRDRAILELLYSAGLRAGEICRLTLADVDSERGTLRILMSKGKKDRMAPVGQTALRWLDHYIQQLHGLRMGDPLFYGPRNTPLTGFQLRRIIKNRQRQADVSIPLHPRLFRHCFAIHVLENGASIRHIQAMMGHSTLKTTQKYLRIMPDELRRAHQGAHPAEHRRSPLPSPDVPLAYSGQKSRMKR